MRGNEYQALAMRTSNRELSKKDHLINGALGLCGESGEFSDLVKKHFYQGHPLDIEHLVKELGDCLWYIAESATALGVDLETVMKMNKEKLEARYPSGFSADHSVSRAKGDV